MGGRGGLHAFVALVAVGTYFAASAARAETPAQLFAASSSGMVKINAHCPGGAQQGTGFLLGPRLVMTARHVMIDEKARSCTAEVVQEGTGKHVEIARWMGVRAARSKSSTDLALATLAAPLEGYHFSISAAAPKRGERVLALGYALGEPLSLNQGHVTRLQTLHGVPVLALSVLEAPGASGGPILTASGQVIGLTQYGSTGLLLSVDLARLTHGRPKELCVGVAARQSATVCDSGGHPIGVLDRDAAPPLCRGFKINPLFETCPKLPPVSETAASVVRVKSVCPSGDPWTGSGFLVGPRLVMTARQVLSDRETGAPCKTTVSQLFGQSIPVTGSIGVQRMDGQVPSDVAILRLASPLKGRYFSLSTTPPAAGQEIHALDYLSPTPDGENEGRVARLLTAYGMPQLELKVDASSPGGPIVDARNRVVGIAQAWDAETNLVYSVDLVRMTNAEPSQFCFGLGDDSSATTCAAPRPSAVLLGEDGPAVVCGKQLAMPPFTYCPSATSGPKLAPITTDVRTPLAFTGCWVTTADSFDPAQKMTTVSGPNPALYFVHPFNFVRVGTSISITATGPTGRHVLDAADALPITNPASTYWRSGPLNRFGTTLSPGTWTFTVAIVSPPSTGASCSATVTVTS